MDAKHKQHDSGRALSAKSIVLAHHDCVYAALSARTFRRLGWHVQTVGTAYEARDLVRAAKPSIAILSTELPDESGWLLCDKLLREQEGINVILVSSRAKPDNHPFANFVGAVGLVLQKDGVPALLAKVEATPLAA